MVQGKQRVSYIIPSPGESVPRLQLPPFGAQQLGATGPLLKYHPGSLERGTTGSTKAAKTPQHRLGVAALALDTSTQLVGHAAPEGILYSGGRDGLVMSWDLQLPMKRRSPKDGREQRSKRARWELLTGWGEESLDDDWLDTDERPTSDGDVLGDVVGTLHRRRQRQATVSDDWPPELQWELDTAAFEPGTATHFRQGAQAHTDWVNDILLCNLNQTVLSASSDGTIKAWNPHATSPSDPTTLGSHNDYVRCLALCREHNWVASASFDRTVKLWDLTRTAASDPLITLHPPESTGPKSSIYALAADPFGHTIASGSPERVVRLWDPRSGKRTAKLVGHTDNIRAILISEDSKYLLTGSADASIKLWSVSSQRCLHTFTHHTESVWSLHSNHPSLEVFYSGDRSGLVCRVDVEDCTDVSQGECVVLCSDSDGSSSTLSSSSSEGINKIVVAEDDLLWTASGTSAIRRWHIPSKRTARTSPSPAGAELTLNDRMHASPPPLKRRIPTFGPATDPPESNTRPSTGQGQPPPLQNRRLSFAPSLQSLSSEVIGRERDDRDEIKRNGLPFDNLVKLISLHDPFYAAHSASSIAGATKPRDAEVSTLYSAASVLSVPRQLQSIRASTSLASAPAMATGANQPLNSSMSFTTPIPAAYTEETMIAPATALSSARIKYEDREWAADAIPFCTAPESVVAGSHGLVRSIILNDRITVLTVDTAGEVAVWDIVRGTCLGSFWAEDVSAAIGAGSSQGGSANGNGNTERERSPREALEAVRERIEGEAAVSTWCSADTKCGVLTIHLIERTCFEAEVYADEVGFAGDSHFNDESKINIGKWVLRNLFIGFILEEQRLRQTQHPSQEEILGPSLARIPSSETVDYHQARQRQTSKDGARPRRHHLPPAQASAITISKNITPAILPVTTTSMHSSPLMAPLIPLQPPSRDSVLPSIPQSPPSGSEGVPTAPPILHIRTRSGTMDSSTAHTPTTANDYFSVQRTRQPSLPSGVGAPVPATPGDDFSGWSGPAGTAVATPMTASKDTSAASQAPPPTPSTPSGGGIMSRLKSFGKLAKRPISGDVTPLATPGPGATGSNTNNTIIEITVQKTPFQLLMEKPWTPPTSTDAPLHQLPPDTVVLFSEEATPNYTTLYRNVVSVLSRDLDKLEETMPIWLAEYLLLNHTPPPAPATKVSFVLMPWNRDPDVEPLPELLNTTQSKLTASRLLRVRKIVAHVQDKLEKMSSSRAASVRSSVEGPSHADYGKHGRPRPEDVYEILCNETLLPLNLTLAAVRQFVWKQSAELVLHYRRKHPPPGNSGHPPVPQIPQHPSNYHPRHRS